VGVRAHRLEGAFVPELRLGEAQELRLSLALGYTTRNLRPEVHHLLTPSYSLSGPVVRPTLRIPLISKRLALRIAPELIIVVDVGQALRQMDIDSSGLGDGREAQLELTLSEYFEVMLAFRESHIVLGSQAEGADGESVTDAERFITARIVGTL
jgi:hypothetical protein